MKELSIIIKDVFSIKLFRILLEMNSLISNPCDSAAEELVACDQEPCFGVFDGFLEVFGETSIAAKPCEDPFDNPSPGQQHKASCRIGALDDLQRPSAQFAQCLGDLGSSVTTIGEDVSEPGEGFSDQALDLREPPAPRERNPVRRGGLVFAPGQTVTGAVRG